MGRHRQWRAQVKKMRRKRLRQKAAQERDKQLLQEQELREKSPRYQAWLAEQHELEAFQREEEARLQMERHLQWERDEEQAQQLWRERQERLARALQEKAKQELRIREEWEEQQRKLKIIEEERRKKEEEKQKQHEELMKQIDDYINKGGELPTEMIVSTATHPDKPSCPFFTKTGACRFGDRCSRNHPRPGVSKVLLIPSFYSHFGMHQAMAEEYDTDVMLEYDDSETYQHFRDFYEDVLPEFEQHGRVIQFKVCCNCEPHLRGNVYIEYASVREAVGAYQKFQGRWYGGRQLNVEFTCVSSWKAAICGLFFKRRCPKGKSCNFLHVFRNPGNQFDDNNQRRRRWRHRNRRSWSRSCSRSLSRSRSRSRSRSFSPNKHRRQSSETNERQNWRWSESPEPKLRPCNGEVSHRSSKRQYKDRDKDRDRNREKSKDWDRDKDRSKRRDGDSQDHSSRRRHSRVRESGSHRKKHRRRSSSTD